MGLGLGRLHVVKELRLALALTAGLTIGGTAQGALIDHGHGLLFDDVLGITWLKDPNYAMTSGFDSDGKMTWDQAMAWVGGLNYLGVTGWRLPTVSPIGGLGFLTDNSNNASTDHGWAKTTTNGTDGGWRDSSGNPVSEMGHLYYVTLANEGACPPDDAVPQNCQYGLGGHVFNNKGPFDWPSPTTGMEFWTGVEWSNNTDLAWTFEFSSSISGGRQQLLSKIAERHAWAVHDGSVERQIQVLPEPGTVALLCIGVVALGYAARRKAV
jgi:hypothetical protein